MPRARPAKLTKPFVVLPLCACMLGPRCVRPRARVSAYGGVKSGVIFTVLGEMWGLHESGSGWVGGRWRCG